MKNLLGRLQLLTPIISEIRGIAGNAGMSVGVVHQKELIYREHFGYQDVEQKAKPDSDTQYHVASLTKAMTSMAFGIAVENGMADWDSLVKSVYPDFKQANETVRNEATITDLLAHRTGLAGKNCYWHQSRQQLLLPKEETASTMSILETVGNFRHDFIYNTWVYGFAGIVLEKILGETCGTFLRREIFEPLGLKRTTLGPPTGSNHVKSYQTLDDGGLVEIPAPPMQDSTIMGTAGGCKTTVNDALIFYSAFLAAAEAQLASNTTKTPNSPFCQVPALVRKHAVASSIDTERQYYGLGWVVTELPSTLELVGRNPRELGSEMPVVGRNSQGKKVWYHNGSLPGAFSAVYLLPDSQSVIVVFTNTLARADTPDWIAQMLLEVLVEEAHPHDFTELTKRTVAKHLTQYPALHEKMLKEQSCGPRLRPLVAYTGRFWNSIGTFFIDVETCEDKLRMWCQGFSSVDYLLYHFDGDTFAWTVNRDQDIKKAIFPKLYESFHKIAFHVDEHGEVRNLSWGHDGAVPQGEVFTRQSKKHDAPVQKPVGEGLLATLLAWLHGAHESETAPRSIASEL